MDIEEFARLGGKARAKSLTPEERSEIARNAVKARWANAKKKAAPKKGAKAKK
jgi:adenosine deaminase